jgi:hypothetical protein
VQETAKRGGAFEMWSIVKENAHLVLLKAMTDLVKQMIQHLVHSKRRRGSRLLCIYNVGEKGRA